MTLLKVKVNYSMISGLKSAVRKYSVGRNSKQLVTALEKTELEALITAKDVSQFGMLGIKRGVGTKEQPNLIPSAYSSRIIGCICEEDTNQINWMWLHKGAPTKCPCGFWFKLVEKSSEQT